jgi:glycosyltransferase involved in cell wall biosynthesis
MDITVVIPTIPERSDLLKRALVSVESQTVQPSNVLVVEAKDGEGAPSVKQRGLLDVKTEWVAMLDDDDEFREDHIEKLTTTADEHDADLVYPWFELIDGDGSVIDPQPNLCHIDSCVYGYISAEGIPWSSELKHWTMTPYKGNVIITGVLMKAPLARKVGGYPQPGDGDWPEFPWEDLGLWRRLLDAGATFAHSPERTYRWHRTHGRNTGGRPDLRKRYYRWMP